MRGDEALEGVDAVRARIEALRPFTDELERRVQGWLVPWFIHCSGALGQRDALSYEQVQAFMEREIVSGGHPIDRFLAVERHREAYDYATKRARDNGPIDLPFVRELHHKLVSGARKPANRPGLWKKSESRAARRRGQQFRYASPEDVPGLMHRLIEGFAKRRKDQHPLAAVAWLHYHFHLVHPFEEENGRVGRLLASTALLQHGYPPLIVPPDELGAYLDALAACDRTVPPAAHAPLAEGIDTSPLLELHAACLERTGARLLDLLEGRELAAADLPEVAVQDQAQTLGVILNSGDVPWRVKGGFQVRALHRRLEAIAQRVVCHGPLYSIRLEESRVVPTHQVSGSEIGAKLPYGDAGVVGELVLSIAGDPKATGLRFAAPVRLSLAVAAARMGMMVLVHRGGGGEPEVHPGPPRSEQWPEAQLDRLLTHTVDRHRRRFEAFLLEENLSAEAQARVREARKQMGTTLLRRRRSGAQTGEPTAVAGGAERAGERTSVLKGLEPTEPPLSF